jgi:hypothetical protein
MRIGKKVQLMAFIPYYVNKQVDDDGTTWTHGLGDITVMGQYLIFQHSKSLGLHKMMNQQLWLGGGLKLPTGPFNTNVDSSTTVADVNAQIGTGSLDFLLNGMYTLNIKDYGINVTASYKINTINGDGYKYGNKFTSNLIAFYHLSVHHNTITPNIGIGYEKVGANTIETKSVQFTGSTVTTGIMGVEYNFNRMAIGINGQLPFIQNFAEGQTKLKFTGMMHITFEL